MTSTAISPCSSNQSNICQCDPVTVDIAPDIVSAYVTRYESGISPANAQAAIDRTATHAANTTANTAIHALTANTACSACQGYIY